MLGRRGARRQGRRGARLAGAGAVLIALAGLATVSGSTPRAFGDASAPPAFPAVCSATGTVTSPLPTTAPVGVAPPPGYPNPPPTAPWTYPLVNPYLSDLKETPPHVVLNQSFTDWYAPSPKYGGRLIPITVGQQYGPGPIQFKAPFRGIVADGTIKFLSKPGAPSVIIPHVFGSLCGTANVPQLTGSIEPADVNMGATNVYVANLEAVPVSTQFGTVTQPLDATILPTPASNGGINAAISGSVTSSVSTLGLTCSLSLPANLTTATGKPVTGPPTDGYAEVVATVPVPALSGSPTCPGVIANTFNKLLGLSATSPGQAKLTTPFCFDFELNGQYTAKPNTLCPWPAG